MIKIDLQSRTPIYEQLQEQILRLSLLGVLRQYEIGGVRYIVKATVKDGAKETAVKKIRRLLQNDLSKAAT